MIFFGKQSKKGATENGNFKAVWWMSSYEKHLLQLQEDFEATTWRITLIGLGPP
jgi:hypothetical protein